MPHASTAGVSQPINPPLVAVFRTASRVLSSDLPLSEWLAADFETAEILAATGGLPVSCPLCLAPMGDPGLHRCKPQVVVVPAVSPLPSSPGQYRLGRATERGVAHRKPRPRPIPEPWLSPAGVAALHRSMEIIAYWEADRTRAEQLGRELAGVTS